MKATLFALFVFSFSLWGAEPKVVSRDKLQFREKGGRKLAYLPNQENPFTGKVVDFHPNGQKILEGNYKNGKVNGLWTAWLKNGQKSREENYKDGKPDGLRTLWWKNGQKRYERNYRDGKLISEVVWKLNGEKCPVTNIDEDGNGVVVSYNEDGTESYRITYKDGIPTAVNIQRPTP